jgi:hypothetical protein
MSTSVNTWITGSIMVNITEVKQDAARMRVYRALAGAPIGAHVVIYVGPLAVNPDVLSVVWEVGRHVTIEVSGETYSVGRWVDALRNGLGVGGGSG